MATWHQERARKRPGFRLFHETKWTALYDPPGQMAGAMLFATYADAVAYRKRLPMVEQQHTIILRPAKQTWIETTEARYIEMLEVVPPAIQLRYGFMVGEAWDHDPLTGEAQFHAYLNVNGRFYEATLPMTVAQFRALNPITAVQEGGAQC